MQFTLAGLKFVEPSLIKILKEDLPIRISYKLSKFFEIVTKEMEKVEMLRQDLVKRYGEEKDGNIAVKKENLLQFNKEFGDLMGETISIEDFEPIDVGVILDYSERLELLGKNPISISAFDIHQLKIVNVLKEGE